MSTIVVRPLEGEPTSTLKETYRIVLQQGQDGWIVVTSPDLGALVTQGRTEDEAIENAYEHQPYLLNIY